MMFRFLVNEHWTFVFGESYHLLLGRFADCMMINFSLILMILWFSLCTMASAMVKP